MKQALPSILALKITQDMFEHNVLQVHEPMIDNHVDGDNHENEHNHVDSVGSIDEAIASLRRYQTSVKSYTDSNGAVSFIKDTDNASRGFFFKKALLQKIINDLDITTEEDCVYFGFGLGETTETSTSLQLVFRKAKYNSETEMMSIDFPNSPIFSTLPIPEQSHLSPPPYNPCGGQEVV